MSTIACSVARGALANLYLGMTAVLRVNRRPRLILYRENTIRRRATFKAVHLSRVEPENAERLSGASPEQIRLCAVPSPVRSRARFRQSSQGLRRSCRIGA